MPYQCFPVNNRVYELFRKRGINEYSLYRLADKMEISMAGVQHCSYNDVGVMQELFSKLGHDELFVPENVKVQLSEKEKKERVLRKIQESKYAFLFTPESKIFHLKSCPRMKNAKILNGCDSFKVAAKKRRPCKVCNPQPPMLDEMEGSLPKLAESAKAADKPKLSECVRVKVVDGSTGVVYRSRIAGFCHYIQHPGAVTKSALEKHQCVEKECRHFEKFEDSPVWLNLEAEARRKAAAKRARKRKKQIEKREEQKLADEQEQIRSLIQESADAAGEAMIVIRVQRESGNRYLVNYVSENHFADGNRFPGMFEKLKEKNPRLRLYLRHMKDLKGHFVTIEEYKRLKRPKN